MDYVRSKFEQQCRKLGLPKRMPTNVEYSTDYEDVDSRLYKAGGPGLEFMDDMFKSLVNQVKDGEELVSIDMDCLFGDRINKVRFIAHVHRPNSVAR